MSHASFPQAALLIIALCLSLFRPAYGNETPQLAGTIWQTGKAIQGGLVIGQIASLDTAVTLDDTPLPVSQNGYFAFGFHRDDTNSQQLIITYDNGSVFTTSLNPEVRSYKTQSISGLESKYVTPPQDITDRIQQDRQNVIKARAQLSSLDDFIVKGFDWPVRGVITGVYGSQRILNGKPRAPHYGIDIAAPSGTPIISPADGIVTMADDLYFTGGTIIIDHGLYISSTMLHLQTMTVQRGDKIKRGDMIGTVGSTGRSTGPHLDWRINWQDKRLDPEIAALALN